MSKVVLDASALLALFNKEPGSQRVLPLLPEAVMIAVNWSEVVAKIAESGVPRHLMRTALSEFQIEIVSFDEELAYEAGLLRPATKELGLSLADRACLALAQKLQVPVVTTDRIWERLSARLKVQVEVVR